MIRFLRTALLCAAVLTGVPADRLGATVPEKQADGVVVAVHDGFLQIKICNDSTIRIAFSRNRSFFDRESLSVVPAPHSTPAWQLSSSGNEATIKTARLTVRAILSSGAVTFLDPSGKPILAEKDDGRSLTSAEVQGEKTFHVEQQWQPNADESLYGLGENQLGLLNIKGYDLDLWQHNGTTVVPFLVSNGRNIAPIRRRSRQSYGDRSTRRRQLWQRAHPAEGASQRCSYPSATAKRTPREFDALGHQRAPAAHPPSSYPDQIRGWTRSHA